MHQPTPDSRTIWTIGHSNHSIDHFISMLSVTSISLVADVRRFPGSRRQPQFAREILAQALAVAGIKYQHFPDLGGLRKPRPDSSNNAWKNPSFRGYADYMRTPLFSAAVDQLLAFGNEPARAVVMCAEAVWWRCHRMLLSDALSGRGVEVEHILGEARPQRHRLTPFARVSDAGEVSYPGVI